MTRDACITDPLLLSLLIAANAVVFLSYTSIPISLLWIVMRAKVEVSFQPLIWLFAAFIMSCGLTHACAVLVFFKPAFYLEAGICAVTAIVSFTTAVLLHRTRRALLAALDEASTLAESVKVARGTAQA